MSNKPMYQRYLNKRFLKIFKKRYGRKQLRNVRKASKGGVMQEGDKLFLVSNYELKGKNENKYYI